MPARRPRQEGEAYLAPAQVFTILITLLATLLVLGAEFFPRSIVLTGVRVLDTPDFDIEGAPLLYVERLMISFDPLGLLRRTFLVESVRFVRPELRLQENELGRWNVASLFAPPAEGPVDSPPAIAQHLESARMHYHHKERCLFCDVIDQELTEGSRIVHVDDGYVTFAPYASRFPYEIHVYPRHHQHQFSDVSDAAMEGLAAHLLEVFRRLDVVLGDAPLNWMLVNAPNPRCSGSPQTWRPRPSLKKIIKDYGEYDIYSDKQTTNIKKAGILAFVFLGLVFGGIYFFKAPPSTAKTAPAASNSNSATPDEQKPRIGAAETHGDSRDTAPGSIQNHEKTTAKNKLEKAEILNEK